MKCLPNAIFVFNCNAILRLSKIFKYMQDGRINYDEFAAMMKKGNPDALTNPRKRREVSLHKFD